MKFAKKLLLLTCCVWLAIGAFGAQVNSEKAASAVKGWLRFAPKPLGASLGASVKNVETFEDKSGAPLYHVVNLEPSGFVIVPAEDQAEPIIAFVEKGHFDPSPANPLGALISRDMPDRVARARSQVTTPAQLASGNKWQLLLQNAAGGPQPKGLGSSRISDLRVAPFVETLWSQGDLLTIVTNDISFSDLLQINTYFDTNSVGDLVTVNVTITNNNNRMIITNGPGWPVPHSFSGHGVTSININNGPDTTVTNVIVVTEAIEIVVTNEFGTVISDQHFNPSVTVTNVVTGSPGATVTSWVTANTEFIMVVSDLKACYNYFTPPHEPRNTNNYVCGCVATAMAQLMYYFQYPSTGVGTPCFTVTVDGNPYAKNLLGGDYNGGPYNWKAMPLDPDYYSLTQPQAQAVGALTHDAGFAVHMQYSESESSAYMTDAQAALVSTFKYNNAIVNPITTNMADTGCFECGLYNMMNPNLDARLPVLLGITGDPGGHAIVCDGYGYSYGALYHHLNMGWSGAYNAWYSLPIIDMYDPLTGTYSYFWDVTDCIYNVFTNGSGEIISGRVLDTGGTPIAGASVTANRVGGGTYTALTDAKGIYALAGVPSASTYVVTATNAGYFAASSNLTTATSSNLGTNSGNVWGADFTLVLAVGAPAIVTQPEDQAVTLGENATFSITARGELPLNYQWQFQPSGTMTWSDLSDSTNYSGTKTATLTVIQPSISQNGEPFRCIVTNLLGSATSTQAVLVVNITPFISVGTLAGLAGNNGNIDGVGSAALFDNPRGIAVDNNTNVYVADMHNHTIRKLTPIGTDWIVSTIAGLAGNSGSADGTDSDARFNGPYGVAVDTGGNVFVADAGNSTIRKLTPVGTNWVVSTIAGLAGNNGSADGTNSVARFHYPTGIAADSGGNAYVSDQGNNTIRKLTPTGVNWMVSTIAGQAGNSGDADGTNSTARFNNPNGIAVDGSGNVYVADTGNSTIRKLTLTATMNYVVNTIAGLAYSSGSADGVGSAARFNNPTGVAVGSDGKVYVADQGNNVIRKLTLTGSSWTVFTVAGQAGSSGSSDGTGNAVRFNGPYGIAVDNNTNVYMTDSFNDTIRGPLNVAPSLSVVQMMKRITDGNVSLTWSALIGRMYQVQFATNLNQATWNNLTNVAASTWTGIVSDPSKSDPQRFYRVRLLP